MLYLSGSAGNVSLADPGLGLVPNGAVTTGYDARAAFDAGLGGATATVETFEGLADQQLVTSVGGLAFSTAAPVESPMATAAFDARSGVLSLGLQNSEQAFVDGDALSVTLATPSTFVGV